MTAKILIVEITTRDDKTTAYECCDFPYIAGDFVTVFKQGFVRESFRTESILRIKQYFK